MTMTRQNLFSKIFTSAVIVSAVVLSFNAPLQVSAQYNGSSTSSVGNANVTTSVTSNSLTINFSNVIAGNTINLSNLTLPDLESLAITFNANVSSGNIVITKVTASDLSAGLPGTFITGFKATYNGFNKSQISNVALGIKVSEATVAKYANIAAYYSNSPWSSTSLNNNGSNGAGSIRYSANSVAFAEFALSGAAADANLIRTGADSTSMMFIAGGAVIAMAYFLYKSVSASSRVNKN